MSRAASTSPIPEQQDLNSIRDGEWPDREFPLGPRERPTRRQVIIKQSVLNEIHGHGPALLLFLNPHVKPLKAHEALMIAAGGNLTRYN